MNTTEKARCENLACLCEVALDVTTCSEYCASPEGRDLHHVRCECGHPGCAEQNERQLHGESGKESL